MKKAIDEMRAWLEEKIKHIEKFIKAYPGSIDIKKARKDMEMMQAIRRRIERKVSREWVEQYLNAIKYCGRDGLMAGLKELGYEVDNA